MGFIVGLVLSCEGVPGKDKLKALKVDIGDGVEISVVTNAPNIREGTRTCIATVGSEIEINGEPQVVMKTTIGGVISEGMVCDSIMLGWSGGAAGIAVQVPDHFALGSPAPSSKPRMDGAAVALPTEMTPELTTKELKAAEKAARKALAAEKKAARKASKLGDGSLNEVSAEIDEIETDDS